MNVTVEESGLEVLDLRNDAAFAGRLARKHDLSAQVAGLERLSRALHEKPETILQELVNLAVEICNGDSAGISIEREGATDDEFYHWVAVAGAYSEFLNVTLPRHPSACGLCLERGHAQHFTVSKKFFDILGVKAPLVTDGILLPWRTEDTRGTLFVMAHGPTNAFDQTDVRIMTMLADFAATGYRDHKQRTRIIAQERATAAAQLANHLAHEINNPLQSMTNTAYMLAEGIGHQDPRVLGQQLAAELDRLSKLVKELLSLPLQPPS